MKHTQLKMCFLLLLCFALQGMMAQKSMPALGGEGTGDAGSTSYTLGQLVVSTHQGTEGALAQGVQQPYEISVVGAIAGTDAVSLTMLVHPNPTAGLLQLTIDRSSFEGLSYQLFDINSRLIAQDNIDAKLTSINMHDLAASSYVIRVRQGNVLLKTFKIIKR